MKKTLTIIIAGLVVIVGVWYLIASGPSEVETENTGPVAVVNGEEISQEELEAAKVQVATQQNVNLELLDEESEREFELQVLDDLIAQTLLDQAFAESDISVSDEDVDTRISATIEQLGGEDQLDSALSTEGLSREDFREQVREEIKAQAYLEQELKISSVTATDEEIEEMYQTVAGQGEDVPPLEEVRDQVEALVIQQKQQALFTGFVEGLREKAEIEILI